MKPPPTFKEERRALAEGYLFIAGTDEVGCGALAGPVFAAAVMLPLHSRIKLIRDSKLLSAKQRDEVFELLMQKSLYGIGQASVEEIDTLNIRQASFLATRRAIKNLKQRPDYILSDGFTIPGLDIPCKKIIGGDRTVKSIAAASIIAKVSRDRLMRKMHLEFPEYGFASHVGYGTAFHRSALKKYGPCPHHRMSFAPIRALK